MAEALQVRACVLTVNGNGVSHVSVGDFKESYHRPFEIQCSLGEIGAS